MNGDLFECYDLVFDVAASIDTPATDDQFAIDQVLRLVADYHAELAASLGQPSPVLPIATLRRSPLGRELRLLAAVGHGEEDAAVADVRAYADHVVTLLLRPLAASDVQVPVWFWQTALGRLLAAALYRTYDPDDLLCAASAAERLDLDQATVDRLIADGTIDAVRDHLGSPYVPVRAVERLRQIAREVDGPSWLPPNSRTDRRPAA